MLQGIDFFAQRKGWIRWHKTRDRELTCPACLKTSLMSSRLDTASPAHRFHRFALFECPNCQTGHFPNLNPPAYETDEYCNSAARKFYIEQGAGIFSMIQPLQQLPKKAGSSFLEVGCGYGFSLHFAKEALRWNSTGFDPSSLARAGAQGLGVTIRAEYLDAKTAPKNGPFDIVYSSEVIEHVVNPDQFLQPITDVLNDDGILTLTTPDIAGLRSGRNLESLLPLISAGSHIILFSKAGLRALLKRCGYRYIKLSSSSDTLLATASKSLCEVQTPKPYSKELYIEYLASQTRRFVKHDQLYTGFAGRLLKEQVNQSKYKAAERTFTELANYWQHAYSIDIHNPKAINLNYIKNMEFEKLSNLVPFNLSVVLYHVGILSLNHKTDIDKAIEMLDASVRCEEVLQQALIKVNVVDLESRVLAGLANALNIGLGALNNVTRAYERLQSAKENTILEPCIDAYDNAELDVFSAASNTRQWDIAQALADTISQKLFEKEITTDRDRSAAIGLAMLALNYNFDRKQGLFWLNKALNKAPKAEPWIGMFAIWGDHSAVRGAELLADGGLKLLASQQQQIANGLLARSAKPEDLGVLLALAEIEAKNNPKLANKFFNRAAKLAKTHADEELGKLVQNSQLQIFLSPTTSPNLIKIWREDMQSFASSNNGPQSLEFALGLDDLNRKKNPISALNWLNKAHKGQDQNLAKEASNALDIAKQQIGNLIISASMQGKYEKITELIELIADGDNEPQTVYALAMYWLNHKNEPLKAAEKFALAAELATSNELRDQANFHRSLALAWAGKTLEAKHIADTLFDDTNKTISSALKTRRDELEAEIKGSAKI